MSATHAVGTDGRTPFGSNHVIRFEGVFLRNKISRNSKHMGPRLNAFRSVIPQVSSVHPMGIDGRTPLGDAAVLAGGVSGLPSDKQPTVDFLAGYDPGRVQGSGCRVQGSGFRVQGSGFRVQGSGFRVQGSGFRIQD